MILLEIHVTTIHSIVQQLAILITLKPTLMQMQNQMAMVIQMHLPIQIQIVGVVIQV